MGIEPTRSAWKAEVLPLNYIRIYFLCNVDYYTTPVLKKSIENSNFLIF